ncbi:hypothetical protein DPMN_037336 [Dreissena polymorpha]|uniref:Uncharacterized protein n=2 Tax=Dreissena polymorpha TaxID=45954 RepID=A0A9D4RPQ5_DREPO|nr:hypothetical protein DPMN_037336 [Dreissena polymorpha]
MNISHKYYKSFKKFSTPPMNITQILQVTQEIQHPTYEHLPQIIQVVQVIQHATYDHPLEILQVFNKFSTSPMNISQIL